MRIDTLRHVLIIKYSPTIYCFYFCVIIIAFNLLFLNICLFEVANKNNNINHNIFIINNYIERKDLGEKGHGILVTSEEADNSAHLREIGDSPDAF